MFLHQLWKQFSTLHLIKKYIDFVILGIKILFCSIIPTCLELNSSVMVIYFSFGFRVYFDDISNFVQYN